MDHTTSRRRRNRYTFNEETFTSRKTHPLDQSRRMRIEGRTRHELEARTAFIESKREEWRLGIITEGEFARFIRAIERREPAHVRPLWDEHVQAAPPEHARKLRSVWRHQLAPWFDGQLVVDLNAARMAQWDRDLAAEGYAPKSAHDSFHHLAAALRKGIPDRFEDLPWKLPGGHFWKPSRSHKTPENERPACGTVEELEALIAAAMLVDKMHRANGKKADAANRIAIVALFALRNGEGSALAWDDLILDGPRPRARIRHNAPDQWRTHYPAWERPLKKPKGKRERTIAIHPTALLALLAQRELLQEWRWYRPDGPVFPSTRGPYKGTWRPDANCIRPETFKRFALLAGLPDWQTWVPHSLRHSAATLESESGASLKSIQGRTGHSSLAQLEEYIHARTGRALVPSAIPALRVTFDAGEEED
jgi:integrase